MPLSRGGRSGTIRQDKSYLTVKPGQKGIMQPFSPWPGVFTDTEENNGLDDCKNNLGVLWIRTAQSWDDVQHASPSAWDWTFMDRVVPKMYSRGFNVLHEITFNTPAWANGNAGLEVLPTDIPNFANYCRTLAQRYSYAIKAWEIFNEPLYNNAVTAYVPVLKAAFNAIREVDPTAEIITGGNPLDGPAGDGRQWIEDIYNLGYGRYFTAIGLHPYDYATPYNDPESNWRHMDLAAGNVRSLMVANGDANKKIWITEIGYPSFNPNNASWNETVESTWLQLAYDTFQAKPWGGPLFWYTYRDPGTAQTTVENFYGIVRNDFSQKIAWTTYQNIANPA